MQQTNRLKESACSDFTDTGSTFGELDSPALASMKHPEAPAGTLGLSDSRNSFVRLATEHLELAKTASRAFLMQKLSLKKLMCAIC
mgnify:CR=1 FL=1